jgi:hypothetical protein
MALFIKHPPPFFGENGPWTHYVAQASLKLSIFLLPQPPKCSEYRHATPCLALKCPILWLCSIYSGLSSIISQYKLSTLVYLLSSKYSLFIFILSGSTMTSTLLHSVFISQFCVFGSIHSSGLTILFLKPFTWESRSPHSSGFLPTLPHYLYFTSSSSSINI